MIGRQTHTTPHKRPARRLQPQRLRFGAVGFVGAITLLAGLAWADAGGATLRGQVRAAANGTPIPGALVTVAPDGAPARADQGRTDHVYTDHAGRFTLHSRATGKVTVTVQHRAYRTWRKALWLRAGGTAQLQVRLQARPGAQRQAKPRTRSAEPAAEEVDRLLSPPPTRKHPKVKRLSLGARGYGHGGGGRGVSAGRITGFAKVATGGGRAYRRPRRSRSAVRYGFIAPQRPDRNTSREGYDHTPDSDFHQAAQRPLSTFSIDVDTASYSNVRRFLTRSRRLPPADAVRIEELLNYFPYHTPEPAGRKPFGVAVELTPAPWNPAHRLARVAIQARKVPMAKLPPANLVFLVDVSGSMYAANKLPLLKRSLAMLVQQLRPQDRVSLVVYAGAAGLVLPPTSGENQHAILRALSSLRAGGSTAGGAGIKLAYSVARKAFRRNGNNRVILCTDGDFNVGQSSDGALVRMIEKQRNSGIFLTVLGFGTGNYQDAKMQKLADKGNGNHAYIDSLLEARKVLVEQLGGTLLTIAKDVKIQIELNPARVASYRLIGYANRKLAARDFKDDKKDAGELGAGHHVTALYELIPAGGEPAKSPLRYQTRRAAQAAASGELMHVKLRWKSPKGRKSKLASFPVSDLPGAFAQASQDHRFAAAVAGFGMLLRHSKHVKAWRWAQVIAVAQGAVGDDPGGHRKAFVQLARQAARLSGAGRITW